MAQILTRQPASADRIAALFPNFPPDDVRPLYPLTVATLTINALKACEPPMPVAIVELEGYETFLQRVRGEFAGSYLEEWEIREAFDIIRAYGRDPNKALRFEMTTVEQQRRLAPVLRAIKGL